MKGLNSGAAFALVVCVSAIMISLHLHKGHFWGDDFAAYIMQAQSIAEGTPEDYLEENLYIGNVVMVEMLCNNIWSFPSRVVISETGLSLFKRRH